MPSLGGCVLPRALPTTLTRAPILPCRNNTDLLAQVTLDRIHMRQYWAEGFVQINPVNPPAIRIVPPGKGVTIDTNWLSSTKYL